MLYIGPISSIFDFLTFFVLLNYFMLANSSSILAGSRIAGDSDLVILFALREVLCEASPAQR